MRHIIHALLLVAALLTPAGAGAQPSADPRVADIVQRGTVRIAMHLPQFKTDPASGELQGHGTGVVIVQIAQAMAAKLGVKLQLVGFPSPPALIMGLNAGDADMGFLGVTSHRATEVGLTSPYILVPFTYLVPERSPIRDVAEADKTGVRIAAVRNHASTLALTRLVKNAEIVSVDIPDNAFDLMRNGQADAWASPRPPLLEYAPKLPGSRVLDGHYGANLQGMAVPKGNEARLAYVNAFIEEAKTTGFVQRAIEQAGERGIEVAPREASAR
jgi:polar amino acid transport system substrate-binding protein